MYLGIILLGTIHSLVFLPVLLSVAGPSLNKQRIYLQKKSSVVKKASPTDTSSSAISKYRKNNSSFNTKIDSKGQPQHK